MPDSNAADYQFLITRGAQQDLWECKQEDSYAAARLGAFLQELRGDPIYLERVIDEHYSDDKIESVAPVWSLQKERINAYRTRIFEVAAWRLIFIVDRKSARIGLFAVMHRDGDYEKDRELWDDIEREFDELGFTHF